jgi:hypothetical protein
MPSEFNETPNLYLRHHMVVGTGDWGWNLMYRFGQALQDSHPGLLTTVECLWINNQGIHWFNWSELLASDLEETNPVSGLINNPPSTFPANLSLYAGMLNSALSMSTAQEKLEIYRRSGFQFVRGDYPLLDIHIVGSLEDALVQQVLLPFVDTLRANRPAGFKFRLYFYLVSDTTEWISLDQTSKSQLVGFLDALDSFLISENNITLTNDVAIGSCYILDTFNEENRAATYKTQESNNMPLGDLIAGLLSLVVGSELPECQEVNALSLGPFVHSSKLNKSKGYCSSFGLKSAVFLITTIQKRLALGLSRQVLARFFPENSTDRDNAASLVTEFSVIHTTDRSVLMAHLLRDERTGKPIRFEYQPVALNFIPENELVDRVLSWDAMIEQNKFKPVIRLTTEKADAVVTEAKIWIRATIDSLMVKKKPSTGDAILFCYLLREKLEKERMSINPSSHEDAHWFSELFARPKKPVEDKVVDQLTLQRRLQLSIGNRVLRLATWQRFAAYAGVENIFVVAAWRFLGPTILQHLRPLVGNLPALVGLGIMVLAILVGNSLAAFYLILASELKIVNAQNDLIRSIQQKYQQRLKNHVQETLNGIYLQLEGYLEQEAQNIRQRSEFICAIDQEMTDLDNKPVSFSTLQQEESILSTNDIKNLIPMNSKEDIDLLYAALIGDSDVQNWRKTEKNLFRRKLLNLVNDRAIKYLRNLSMENYLDSNPGRYPLPELVQKLESDTKVQLNLSGFGTAHRLSFLAIDDENLSQAPKALQDKRRTVLITTRDRSRISYLKTVHGLELKNLKLWENLK